MKKVIKIVVGIIVVLLILLIGFIVSLPVTIAPVVKKAAAAGGPKALGVNVSVGDVKLRPIAGQLLISDFKVGNPEGYTADKDSFAVKTIDIDLETKTLIKGDTIVIEKILIDAPEIFYEVKDGKSNFDTMLAKAQKAEKEQKEKKDSGDKPKKKVVINEFVLKSSKVAYSSKMTFGKPITIPLPTVKVNDIGKGSGGVSGVEALGQIVPEIINGLKDAVTGAASSLGSGVTDAVKIGGDTAKEATESASKAVEDAAGSAGKALEGVTGSAGDAAKDAADSASKAAKDAGKKLKGLFGK